MTGVEIVTAVEGERLQQARSLIIEYAESRGFPLSWQRFDEEVASLPGAYAPPEGRLLLALAEGLPAGCVGLRRIDAESCEMKRLYVRPASRGLGIGRLLAERVIEEARALGYDAMLLDTLDRMEEAGGLYRALGFVPTEPYRYNPLPDVVYLRLDVHLRPQRKAPSEDVVIRRARPGDGPAIARIYNQAVEHSTATFDTEPQTSQDREAWLEEHAAPQHPVLVAEHQGQVVGWSSLSRYSTRCAYLSTAEASTYIDEAHAGRGIGRRLGEALLEAGRAGGVHAVIARICTENVASLSMCRRLGFLEVGVLREVGRKFGRLLDVMMLEKILDDGDLPT